jgi:hypothetical protein
MLVLASVENTLKLLMHECKSPDLAQRWRWRNNIIAREAILEFVMLPADFLPLVKDFVKVESRSGYTITSTLQRLTHNRSHRRRPMRIEDVIDPTVGFIAEHKIEIR